MGTHFQGMVQTGIYGRWKKWIKNRQRSKEVNSEKGQRCFCFHCGNKLFQLFEYIGDECYIRVNIRDNLVYRCFVCDKFLLVKRLKESILFRIMLNKETD